MVDLLLVTLVAADDGVRVERQVRALLDGLLHKPERISPVGLIEVAFGWSWTAAHRVQHSRSDRAPG